VTNRGAIIGDGQWSKRHFVTEARAREMNAEADKSDAWGKISTLAENLSKLARRDCETAFEKFDELSAAITVLRDGKAIEGRG
jgi:hypothetical protein